jgi:D-serine deaminase-like pyridoxal phosphate-dependent protein
MRHVITEPRARYERYRRVVDGEAMPCAIVDLDALEANARALVRPLAGSGKTMRVATKSVRCPDLVTYVRDAASAVARGLMTYTAAETMFWARRGEKDLLLAYPVSRDSEAAQVAEANAVGAAAAVVADSREHLELLGAAARAARVTIPVVLEVDVSWRPLGDVGVHVGVRRSPLREPGDIIALARAAVATESLRFHGVMAYEAQIAGVGDATAAVRAMKAASTREVVRTRARIAQALSDARLKPPMFNGGGTGTARACASEAALTEVTIGSGFVDSHLFDHYTGLELQPAAYFALAVVRRPAARIVTCHGGGYVASGAAGRDRLPVPALPEGVKLLRLEGAGEVQTPLELPDGVDLALGDPVFFRHAKAGELAEHFTEYILVRGDRVVGRAPTYRGLGKCFLG